MQQVHINRLGVNSIEFEMDTVELPLSPGEERSFEIVMINYGAPTHVNISVSDILRENITILEDNPYVKHEEYIPLIARIPYDGRLYSKGQVFITVGYGSKREAFDLNLGHPGPNEKSFVVDVDESLYKPAQVSKAVKPSKPSKPSSSGMYDKDHWSAQLPTISAEMVRSVFGMAAPHSSMIIRLVLLVLVLSVLAVVIRSVDLSQFFTFYPSVVYSILLTFFMVYLLIRLPNIRK
ncbi:hypothetical protein SAMN04488696_0104 [Methanolobus profundi]|uniref:Uncharacterized protein n=1 Tax=Methanolobus profundi TaxID=487685 RepID=A0A1I4NK32_9EURY|nr:hypothetical protein [Methanolobus profundi]SFM15868.1 hypothetical protein SAMN04488696_0104 [Methanolobus profundi]